MVLRAPDTCVMHVPGWTFQRRQHWAPWVAENNISPSWAEVDGRLQLQSCQDIHFQSAACSGCVCPQHANPRRYSLVAEACFTHCHVLPSCTQWRGNSPRGVGGDGQNGGRVPELKAASGPLKHHTYHTALACPLSPQSSRPPHCLPGGSSQPAADTFLCPLTHCQILSIRR